jgi:hypothetical protein
MDKERGDWRRRNLLYLASEIGTKARPLLPTIQDSLNDKSRQVQVAAALALAKVSGETSRSIPVLIRCVRKKDMDGVVQYSGTQGYAAEALGMLGPQAKESVPLLLKLLGEKDTGIDETIQTALALIRIDSEQQTEVALQALRDLVSADYLPGAKDAAEALSEFGPKAVPILVQMLHDERRGRRRAGVDALKRIGPNARDAIPALQVAMKDQKPTVRCAILEACAKIDATKSQTILFNAVNDSAWSVRFAALKGIDMINPLPKEVLLAIEKLQADEDSEVKALAARVLKSKRIEPK